MRFHFLLSRKNESGYTLVEGIIQLTVLMLFSQVFAITIGWINKMENDVTNPTEIEWALFVRDVGVYLNDVDMIGIQKENTGIRFLKEGVEFDIELYENLIRKQKNRLGHEQMLLHIRSISTKMDGSFLHFSVEFLNGTKKEHTFYVTFRKE